MAITDHRLSRGRRRGRSELATAVAELRMARITACLSQDAVAKAINCSQSTYSRIEEDHPDSTSVVRLAELASVLGMELSVRLYPLGDPLLDKGQQALGGRFEALLSPWWRVSAEMLLPMPGDLRSWDRLLRLTTGPDAGYLVGVDLETRIRDIQALVRRTRQRERDGHVDAILVVLSDSATNRGLAGDLRHALGPRYESPARDILAALREGRPLPGSGVILV